MREVACGACLRCGRKAFGRKWPRRSCAFCTFVSVQGGVPLKNNKLSRMLEPSLGLYLACLVLFALASAFFSIPLAVIEGVVVIILYLYLRRSNSIR